MSNKEYTPPKVWTWDSENGGKWAGTNRPIAGPTHEKTLPTGENHYSCIRWAHPMESKSR